MAEDGPIETVRHEEVVRARTERVVTGRARLQRVVVRERRTIEVEVAHEEYRLVVDEVEPESPVPADLDATGAGPRTASTVLHEERIEIVRRTVPVERVTLVVAPVAGTVSGEAAVRREEVEVDPGNPGHR